MQGGCKRQTCYHCNNSSHGKGISCRQEGIVYELKCSICEEAGNKARYVGESSRSFYERLGEHYYLFKHKKEGDPEKNEASSALWLHSKAKHNGEMKTTHWKTKILSSHRTALNRQVTEATIISNEGLDVLLNSKNEFGANNLPELVLQHCTRIDGAAKRWHQPSFQPKRKKRSKQKFQTYRNKILKSMTMS